MSPPDGVCRVLVLNAMGSPAEAAGGGAVRGGMGCGWTLLRYRVHGYVSCIPGSVGLLRLTRPGWSDQVSRCWQLGIRYRWRADGRGGADAAWTRRPRPSGPAAAGCCCPHLRARARHPRTRGPAGAEGPTWPATRRRLTLTHQTSTWTSMELNANSELLHRHASRQSPCFW